MSGHQPQEEIFSYGDNLIDLGVWEAENPYSPKSKHIPIHAVKFHDACQALGIVAAYDIREMSRFAFSGRVEFAGTVVEHEGTVSSKKLVKEGLCTRALPILQSLSGELKARKVSLAEETRRHLYGENWIGILQRYTDKARIPKPQFNELMTNRTPSQYTCTVYIEGGDLTTFGSTWKLFPSKADARKSAAREAVLWLRNQGKVESGASTNRSTAAQQRKLDLQAAPVGSGTNLFGVFQQPNDVNVNTAVESLPTQVHALIASLGFVQPSFDARPCAPPPSLGGNISLTGFVDMAAHFHDADVQTEPRLAGDQGVVRQVYGRRRARQLCCRELLRVLEEVKRSRGV